LEIIHTLTEWANQNRTGIVYVSWGILSLGIFQNIMYFMQIILAALELRRTHLRTRSEENWRMITSDVALPISILIPAYNEEVTIVETVKSTLATQYPSFEIIVCNDGSKDRTLEVLKEAFDMKISKRFYEEVLDHKPIRNVYRSSNYVNLIVVDKENGGRSDAINSGIDVASNPLFCTLDADSMLDSTALTHAVQPFMERPD
jgi:cellulose synthase/poly-beta-1,6-N-acetylglucosamine synthase-like glycosyltransferase